MRLLFEIWRAFWKALHHADADQVQNLCGFPKSFHASQKMKNPGGLEGHNRGLIQFVWLIAFRRSGRLELRMWRR